MPPLPVLYSFRRCPYAMRARLALKYAGVAVELREVVLRHKPAALLALSPKGTVPVLQLDNGQVLDESLDIMRWALAQADPEGWLLQGDAAQTQALIALNDGPFKALLDRYKYPDRYPAPPARGSLSAAHYRQQAVDMMVQPLEERLDATPCLFGPSLSLADMALLPFVRQFAMVDMEWFESSPYRAVQAWLGRLTASDLFTTVMPKFTPWQAGDPVTVV
jgi:glutathione S-transferase